MFLRIAYTVFIGILLATFVGVGIAAFYPGPKQPTSSSTPYTPKIESEMTPEERAEQNKIAAREQEKWNAYNEASKNYNRDVSVIALVASVLMLALGLTLVRKIYMISDGLLLGGVITLVYSIIRSFGANNNQFQFVVVSVGLIAALVLGYIKFVKPHETTRSKK
jgi:xanthine/uracil permease